MHDHPIFDGDTHCCACLAESQHPHRFNTDGCEWCDDTIHLVYVDSLGTPAIGLTDELGVVTNLYISAFLEA